MTFEASIQAVKTCTKRQWDMADALLIEVGPYDRSLSGRAKLKEVAAELLEHGLEYDVSELAKLQRAAHDFPKNKRIETMTPEQHLAAWTIDFFKAIVAAWPNIKSMSNERLTPKHIASLRRMKKLHDQESSKP